MRMCVLACACVRLTSSLHLPLAPSAQELLRMTPAPKSIHRSLSLPPSLLSVLSRRHVCLVSVFTCASCPIFQRASPLPSSLFPLPSSLSFHFSCSPVPRPPPAPARSLQYSLVIRGAIDFLKKDLELALFPPTLPLRSWTHMESWRERALRIVRGRRRKSELVCGVDQMSERGGRAAMRCRESRRASVRVSEVKLKPFSVFSVLRL